MTEPGSGWRESVDHVVSDFDVVTRHLRVRQGQALRVAWSVVLATAVALGALIVLSLRPSAPSTPVAGLPASQAPLAITQPGGVLVPGAGLGLLPTSSARHGERRPLLERGDERPERDPGPGPGPAAGHRRARAGPGDAGPGIPPGAGDRGHRAHLDPGRHARADGLASSTASSAASSRLVG